MRGIILSGGLGSRLYPITFNTCKQLLPIYDKPMIYYPLATLMQASIREILIICRPRDIPSFRNVLSDGSYLGLDITYAEQADANGIAHSFTIAESFIQNQPVALILGDNIFYGHDLPQILAPCSNHTKGAHIFGYQVDDPERYGVLSFDQEGCVDGIIEKPRDPPSSYAVTGLYFYDHQIVDIARTLKPSQRGEYEITDVNNIYLSQNQLETTLLDRDVAWFDTGTFEAMHQASTYVKTVQDKQGIQVGCIEEIAYHQGFIDINQLEKLAYAQASMSFNTV
ncbi:MAG: glucose-1-phosphate thymidylyltransferase RfbA [Chlamydiales bacterium]|nr:glucose-1-phosphate thymidylyltransferase RfbA [Chlamydiales bacterium]